MKTFYSLIFLAFVFTDSLFAQAGKPDSSFGTNGQVVTSFDMQQAFLNTGALLPDGRIIAGGSVGELYSDTNVLIQYKANGKLDLSFGSGGVSKTSLGNKASAINALALQQDGKIVTAGYYGNSGLTNLSVVRYNKNGVIDFSFGNNGVVLLSYFKNKVKGNSIAVQPDGKIVVAGSISQGSVDDPTSGIMVARLNINGSLDSSFNLTGIKLVRLGVVCGAGGIKVLNDGKILLAAYSFAYKDTTTNYTVIKFNANGKEDLSFGKNGIAVAPFRAQGYAVVNAIAVQKDGKIVLGGALDKVYITSTDFGIVRFNATGSIDSSFGNNGSVLTDFGGFDYVNSLALQADGKIIAAGVNRYNGLSYFALSRYNKNGKLDISFGSNGKVLTGFVNFQNKKVDGANVVLLQPDETILALGNANRMNLDRNSFALAKYLNDVVRNNAPITSSITVKLSPNPVINSIYIEGLHADSKTVLTITDQAGNVFKQITVTEANYNWNIADLKSGFYYLVIQNNYRKTSFSIIKQ